MLSLNNFNPQMPFYIYGLRAVLPNNEPGHEGKRFCVYDFNTYTIRPEESTNEFSLDAEYRSAVLGSTIRTRLPCRIVEGELPTAFGHLLLTEDALVAISDKDGEESEWTFYSF
ncbi:hypothetical protein VNI00_000203 [Paramarasmius palmivorus]|uniref:Uncharacterized protein n=1 Tax=Paramarasmius palmivorus TaxID=297713 RepID=A0AAW0EF55_9AGAR